MYPNLQQNQNQPINFYQNEQQPPQSIQYNSYYQQQHYQQPIQPSSMYLNYQQAPPQEPAAFNMSSFYPPTNPTPCFGAFNGYNAKKRRLNNGQVEAYSFLQIEALKQEIAVLKKSQVGAVISHQIEQNRLRNELMAVQKKLNLTQTELDEIEPQLRNAKCGQIVQNLLLNEAEQKCEQFDAVKKDLAVLRGLYRNLKKENNKLRAHNEELLAQQQCIKSLRAEKMELRNQYEKILVTKRALQTQYNELGQKIDALSSEQQNTSKHTESLNAEIVKLRKQYENTRAQKRALQAHNEKLQQAADKNNAIIGKLKKCVIYGTAINLLRDLKFPPITSEDGMQRTQRVYNLKQESFNPKIITKTRFAFSRAVHIKLEAFFKTNKHDRQRYVNPITTENGKRLNDITEKFQIQEHRSESLRYQIGLRANQNISDDAVLGTYSGLECTNEEWERAFIGTNCYEKNMKYLHRFDVGKGKNKLSVIIDPIAAKLGAFGGLYINDCRKDTRCLTEEDEERINCEWIEVKHHGWPCIVLKTTREICKGEELLMDYGDWYWTRIAYQNELQSAQNERKVRSVEQICNDQPV